MIQSMTGYGCRQQDGLKVEIRSLNHRYLNINMKLPQSLLKYDMVLRKIIKETLSRGQVEVYINYMSEYPAKLSINDGFVTSLVKAMEGLKDKCPINGNIDVATVLSFRESISNEPEEVEENFLLELFRGAICDLVDMRTKEAENIIFDIKNKITNIEDIVKKIDDKAQGFAKRAYEKVDKKIQELLGSIVNDRERLLQEAAYLAEKADITEELERLKSHVKQFSESLLNTTIVGKKLDFIIQELYRETNTIGSKSQEFDISVLTVELKDNVEQLREQVQNIQ